MKLKRWKMLFSILVDHKILLRSSNPVCTAIRYLCLFAIVLIELSSFDQLKISLSISLPFNSAATMFKCAGLVFLVSFSFSSVMSVQTAKQAPGAMPPQLPPQFPQFPMLPIEINVPDTISSIYSGFMSMWQTIQMFFSMMNMDGADPSSYQSIFVFTNNQVRSEWTQNTISFCQIE